MHAAERILIVSAKERTIVTFYKANNGIRSLQEVMAEHWHQYNDVVFHFNGKHIVVSQADGTFITLLKNAANNRWFNQAGVLFTK